jgi:hypothetical protein
MSATKSDVVRAQVAAAVYAENPGFFPGSDLELAEDGTTACCGSDVDHGVGPAGYEPVCAACGAAVEAS